MRVAFLPLPPGGDALAAWRAAGSPREILLDGACALADLQRLGRRATVWLEATPRDADEALDLAVAGAGHVLARWPRDQAFVTTIGPGLGDLLAVACAAEDADAVRAAVPEALVAKPAGGDGAGRDLDLPEPEPEPPAVDADEDADANDRKGEPAHPAEPEPPVEPEAPAEPGQAGGEA